MQQGFNQGYGSPFGGMGGFPGQGYGFGGMGNQFMGGGYGYQPQPQYGYGGMGNQFMGGFPGQGYGAPSGGMYAPRGEMPREPMRGGFGGFQGPRRGFGGYGGFDPRMMGNRPFSPSQSPTSPDQLAVAT